MSDQPTPTAQRRSAADEPTLRAAVGEVSPGDLARAFAAARYVPQRPHAEGGLGRVYVALDREFGREVALKRLKDELFVAPDDAARFEREAALTGRLEHPGIVPVYGLGRDADGRPYYAMRFVRGESLQAAAKRFHASGRVDFRSLDFRTLLARFVAACNAVAYAHSCGVVHRDLKPANVMLGPFGETLVVDWGLAKESRGAGERGGRGVDDTAESPLIAPAPTTPFAPAPGGSSTDETQPGSVIGTPAYMSPEQARGDEVGPAGDVYGLGATLYVLLAGVTPFPGQDAGTVIEAVRAGRVPPVSVWKPDAPAALRAVCAKAMAYAPADRYASPLDLARDVERWLADEPTAAFAEPLATRAGRWVRRRKTLVGSAAAAAAVGLVGLGVATVLLGSSNARERAARAAADANFARARMAVDEMLTAVGDHPRLKQGDFHAVRRELLAKAIPYYEEFAKQKGDDPALLLERARALDRLGGLRVEMGEPAAALDDFRAAEALLAPLTDRTAEVRTLLASTLDRQAVALRNLNRRPEAEDAGRRAADLYGLLAAADPGDVRVRTRWAGSLSTLGVIVMERKRFADAEAILRKAVELREAPLAAGALKPDERVGFAMTLNNLGNALADLNREADAESQYRRALDVLAKLTAEDPKVLSPRWMLVTGRANLAILLRDTDRPDDAEAEYRRAAADYAKLRADFPAVTQIRREAARNRNNYASLLQQRGRYADAEREFRAALAEREALDREFPTERGYRGEIARNRTNLGKLFREQKRWDDAAAEFRAAAEMLAAMGGDNPAGMPNAADLGEAWASLGRVERDRGNADAALPWLTKAAALLADARGRNAQSPPLTRTLRGTLRDRAGVLVSLGRAADALPDLDRALELADDKTRPEVRLERAKALARSGAVEEAAAEVEDVTKSAKGDTLVAAARAWAVVADAGDTAARDDRQARAVALLKSAGPLKPDQLRHADFDALRDRDDFRKLLP